MDKKYTSLESTIRNVVRGNTGAAQDNRSLESKIRSVVLKEEVELVEAPNDAAPPGDGHLSVHELFGHLRDYNEDHDRCTDPEDPDEEGAKESRADINSTEKMIKKIHGQDTLDHVRNAIESERHIRLGTNPGVNNHQAVKDHLDAAVRASRHFSEALGTGGNEGGEFKGTAPAFFKPFHAEPKVGDSHPAAKSSASVARDRAKISTSETMKKESYIITPTGRSSLNEGGSKATGFLRTLVKGGAKVEPEAETALRAAGKLEPEAEAAMKAAGKLEPETEAAGKGSKAGRLGKIATLGVGADLVNSLFGGNAGVGDLPVDASDNDLTDRFELPRNRHFAKNRVTYGPEVHYKEDADAERSAIENVARPNSKNRLTKNAEIQRKILEDTARRKEVILRAKEEIKNGRDGGNSMVNTKPELKHVKEAEETGVWGSIKKGLNKINPLYDPNMPEYGAADLALDAASLAPVVGAPASAASAYRNLKRGDYGYAALDALGAIPLVGWAAKGAKGASLMSKAAKAAHLGNAAQLAMAAPDIHNTIKDVQAQDQSSYGAAAGKVASAVGTGIADMASQGYDDAKNWIAGKTSGSDSNSAAANEPKNETPGQDETPSAPSKTETPGQPGSKGENSSGQLGTTVVASRGDSKSKEQGSKVKHIYMPSSTARGESKTKAYNPVGKTVVAQSNRPADRPAKSAAGSDYENARTAAFRANPNSVGARSALPPEARGAAPLPPVPTVSEPQTPKGINSTNTPASPTMGSSWNNSYKNKYSMGPGPSQFPSK